MLKFLLRLLPALFIVACASKPPATPPNRVQLISANQKDDRCKSLGEFSVRQRAGPDKTTAVLVKGMTEVSNRGGNAMVVVSNSVDWEDGALLTGEALLCQF